jgi:hypothetical protein
MISLLFGVDVVVRFMRLDEMLDHVAQHLLHVAVGDTVKGVLAPDGALSAADDGGTPATG